MQRAVGDPALRCVALQPSIRREVIHHRMRYRLVTAGLTLAGIATAIAATLAVRRRRNGDRVPPPARPSADSLTASGTRRPDDLEPHPTGIFAALGRFDYRFRRVIPVIGLLVAVAVVDMGRDWRAERSSRAGG